MIFKNTRIFAPKVNMYNQVKIPATNKAMKSVLKECNEISPVIKQTN